ncbi:MAG: hypothetical protein ACXAD7_07580 [Candidatus Kariarchaeaceae archaeon]|jgi:hypothetical protein
MQYRYPERVEKGLLFLNELVAKKRYELISVIFHPDYLFTPNDTTTETNILYTEEDERLGDLRVLNYGSNPCTNG